MSNCSTCFEDYLSNCEDHIQVNALLEPATEYKWVITDRLNNQYEGLATTESDGFFAISLADLPDGFINKFAGQFKLEIFESTNECRKVNFLAAKYYDCITFDVTGGTNSKPNLGCEFNCIGDIIVVY